MKKLLPPLNTLHKYTVVLDVKPLVNESNNYPGYVDLRFSEPQLEFNIHVCVKYKSIVEESSNQHKSMPDGLSCNTRGFLPYQQVVAENKEEIILKGILDNLYIPFDLDKRFAATKIVEMIDYASSPVNNPIITFCNVLPLNVEITKTIVLPDVLFECYRYWHHASGRIDPKFEEEYKRAISRPRTSAEEIVAEQVRLLCSHQVTDLEGLGDDDKDCPICLEEMELGYAMKLGCSHMFHVDCITKWKRGAAKGTRCPLCRADWVIWAWHDSLEKLSTIFTDDEDMEAVDAESPRPDSIPSANSWVNMGGPGVQNLPSIQSIDH